MTDVYVLTRSTDWGIEEVVAVYAVEEDAIAAMAPTGDAVVAATFHPRKPQTTPLGPKARGGS